MPAGRDSWRPDPHVKAVYVCSEHFISGEPVNQPKHPDYVPSLSLDAIDASDVTPVSQQRIRRYNGVMKRHLPVHTGTKMTPANHRKVKRVLHRDLLENIAPVTEDEADMAREQMDEIPGTPDSARRSPIMSAPVTPTGITNAARIVPAQVLISDSDNLLVFGEVAALQQQCDSLKAQLATAQARLNTARFGVNAVEGNDVKCLFYTGINWYTFLTLYDTLAESTSGKGIPIVSYIDQLFFTLVKLRQNPKFEYLADQAGIAESTMVDHFWKWIDIINVKLDWWVGWPDREYIFRTTPPHFKALYPRLTSIIDCFEIFVEAPSNLKAGAQLWSNYKKHTTVKFIIACSPLGAVTFLSAAWGGRASDLEIVKKSGFLTTLDHHPGDQILADRGFTLKDEFAAVAGVELITPAFIKGQNQFAAAEVEIARQTSSVRIHVEQVIGAIKNRFAILQGTMPLRVIKSLKDEADGAALTSADKLVRSCSILLNLYPSIVYND